MLVLCDGLDAAIRRSAGIAGRLILLIALVQIAVLSLRYFFSVGSILLQELILNLNVVLVSLSIGCGVLRDVHTRVDAFKERQSESLRVGIELACVLGLMLPTALFLVWALIPYVAQSWASGEGSRNVGGMGGIYIVKSFILLMAGLLALQAAALVARIVAYRRWPYPDGASGPVDG
jgi:TRAP-type mannitol/chloroaromatic compound transport system permease small subunit